MMAIEDRRDSSENSGGPSSGSHTFFWLVQVLLEYTSSAPQKKISVKIWIILQYKGAFVQFKK